MCLAYLDILTTECCVILRHELLFSSELVAPKTLFAAKAVRIDPKMSSFMFPKVDT